MAKKKQMENRNDMAVGWQNQSVTGVKTIQYGWAGTECTVNNQKFILIVGLLPFHTGHERRRRCCLHLFARGVRTLVTCHCTTRTECGMWNCRGVISYDSESSSAVVVWWYGGSGRVWYQPMIMVVCCNQPWPGQSWWYLV